MKIHIAHAGLAIAASALVLTACGNELPQNINVQDQNPIVEEEPERPAPTPDPEEEDKPEEPADLEPQPEPEPEEPAAVCGDGQVTGEELCDGTNLNGVDCRAAGFAGGNIQCAAGCQAVQTGSCTPLTPTPILPQGQTLSLQDSIDDTDATWKRPNASCGDGFSSGYYFDAHAIVNNTGAPQQIRISSAWGGGDGFLHVFSQPWNPITNEGCMVGNDDSDGTSGSLLPDVTIGPGQTLVVVASAFGADTAIGAYDLAIETLTPDAPPPVIGEPEPQPQDPNEPAAPTCGNGVIEEGEVCDGSNLGGINCQELGYDFGFVLCGGGCGAYLQFCTGLNDDGTPEEPVNPSNATPVGDPGLTIQLTGTVDAADPTRVRPTSSCGASSTTAAYELHHIVNNGGATRSLDLQASWAEDGYLAVYSANSFDEADAAAGCLQADDDYSANGANARNGSRIEDLLIFPGEELVVVATSFGSTPAGAYTIDVTSKNNGDAQPVASLAGSGGSVTTVGTLSNTDAKWSRIGSTCTSSAQAGDYFYDRFLVKNEGSYTRDVEILATWANGDGYLHAYVFDEADEMGTGLCLGANDDYNGSSQSRIDNVDVFAGETLAIIASTFSADAAIGAYQLEVKTK